MAHAGLPIPSDASAVYATAGYTAIVVLHLTQEKSHFGDFSPKTVHNSGRVSNCKIMRA